MGYYHKLYAPQDPTSPIVVKKMLTGVAKLRPTKDSRRPITPVILRKLVWAANGVAGSRYVQILLEAMFTLAFHGFYPSVN